MKPLSLFTAAFIVAACSQASVPDAAAHDEGAHTKPAQIYVSGQGTSSRVPNQAVVMAGVVTNAPTASEAMRANAAKMNAVFDQLKSVGIKQRDIQTSQLSLQPQYDYKGRGSKSGEPNIIGYEARNTVSARTDDIENAGKLIDAVISAGVNNINGINFSIKDDKAARSEARAAAVKDARAKAEQLASAAGVRLGRVLEIREGGGQHQPRPMMMARGMAAESATPIAAGEQQVSVQVSISYAID